MANNKQASVAHKSGTFYFYDLETSGVNARSDRIMQFGGQRTDMDLNPIGQPANVLVKMTEDVLPEPDAVMVTGITPQKTLAEGISEAEFANQFLREIVQPGTIFVGFNSIRFDDEFMRFFLFRNFRDAYEWQWKDSNSRWDMLDVSRMARALRPEGLVWPLDDSGKPSNRLELLASANKFDHDNAHDALSDVFATIALAKRLKNKQPKLFDYLLQMRDKRKVQSFINSEDYFVYSSGKYPGEFEKTTIVTNLGPHPDKQGNLVYDLRYDPDEILKLSPEQLAEKWRYDPKNPDDRLPVKGLQFNRCPAVAPISVLDGESIKRIKIDMDQVAKNYKIISADKEFVTRLHKALLILNKDRDEKRALVVDQRSVDSSLYEGFVPDHDRKLLPEFHKADPGRLEGFIDRFNDQRLKTLVPLFKARNFPKNLTGEEREAWDSYRKDVLTSGGENSKVAKFNSRLAALQTEAKTAERQYLLEELNLYAQSLL